MCQIFIKKAGSSIPLSYLRNAFDNNPDGIGILTVDDNENVDVTCELASWSRVQELVEQTKDYKAIVHFRYGTSGAINQNNLHPFELKHGWWLFHNGILDCVDYSLLKDGENDTQLFIRTHLDPIMQWNSETVLEHLPSIEMLIGKNNRMILVSSHGDFHYVNRNTFFTPKSHSHLVIANHYSMVKVKPTDSTWVKVSGHNLMSHVNLPLKLDRYSGVLYRQLDRNMVIWARPSEVDYSPTFNEYPECRLVS